MQLENTLMGMIRCSEEGVVEEVLYQRDPEKSGLSPGTKVFDKLALDEQKEKRLRAFFKERETLLGLMLNKSSGENKEILLHGFPMARGYILILEETFYCGEDCQQSYEAIMRLNSQFVNAQREVAKKNEELRRMNEKLKSMASKDPLTGLLNRHGLQEKFLEQVKRCERLAIPMTMGMVDFNHFKKVNDELGHGEGDRLLKTFADISLRETRTGFDHVFRIGGDEFLFLFEDCGEKEARQIILRIERELKEHTRIVSLAYGFEEVSVKKDPPKLEKLLAKVDQAMYRDKRQKKET